METFNGITKFGFILLTFRALSKEFYLKQKIKNNGHSAFLLQVARWWEANTEHSW
jgi:hypothetical protein